MPIKSEYSIINNMLSKEEVNIIDLNNKLDNSMVIINDDVIIGFANYITLDKDNTGVGIIHTILIEKPYRNQYLGDGLIKALLNLIKNRGINIVHSFVVPEKAHFFESVGFSKEAQRNPSIILEAQNRGIIINNDSLIYSAKLSEFFLKSCKAR